MGIRKIAMTVLYYAFIVGVFVAVTLGYNKTAAAVQQKVHLQAAHTVIIDPGHGGEDGGASSCTGALESGINLDIAKKVNDLFCLLGYRTKMLRQNDTSVYTQGETLSQKKVSDLKNRVAMVNRTKHGILVSIHQNFFLDSQYSGGQVFYSPTAGSRELAENMQAAFCQSVNPGSSRKCKRSDGIYLMQHIQCPGILVECGFLSNPEEEAKLRTDAYQKQLACVITSVVSEYLDRESAG